MTDQHPITPSPELVQQWRDYPEYTDGKRKLVMVTLSTGKLQDIATKASQWGADTELLACGDYLERCAAWEEEDVTEFYNYRRPRPPSLKEQALAALKRQAVRSVPSLIATEDCDTIRRALEALHD